MRNLAYTQLRSSSGLRVLGLGFRIQRSVKNHHWEHFLIQPRGTPKRGSQQGLIYIFKPFFLKNRKAGLMKFSLRNIYDKIPIIVDFLRDMEYMLTICDTSG